MPNCNSYQKLTIHQKKQLYADILIAMQENEECFYQCLVIIDYARSKGVYNNVKIITERELKSFSGPFKETEAIPY